MTQWQRRAEARAVPADWIPAFAGMTQWQRRAEARATASLHADELYVEDDGLVRADRRLRGVAVGLLGRQHDFPARAGRHLRQRFAQAHQRDLVELHAHRAGLLAFGRAEGVDARLAAGRQRAPVVDRHFAGLGGLGAVAGSNHAVLHAAGQRLHAGLGLVLGEEGVALGLVGRRSLVELRLGLGHLALLHVLHRAAQLVDGNRRLLLRIAVLHGLDDGVDVDRFTAFDQVATEVVTERIAHIAFRTEERRVGEEWDSNC